MIVDILVPVAAWEWVDWTGDTDAVDAARAASSVGFTGAEIGALVGVAARTVGGLQALCTNTDVATGLSFRGAVLVTGDGVAGLSLGAGMVMEPAGRVWAVITAPPASRYVWAGLSPAVRYTIARPA